MADSSTIQDAVAKAAEAQGHVEEVDNETAETTKETPQDKQEENTDLADRTARALEILDQLEDPDNGKAFVKQIAKQLGLLEDAETKTEAKKATANVSRIKDKMIAAIGEDYPILAEKLGTVIEEAIGEAEEKFTKEITTRDAARLQAEIDTRVEKFIKTEKITDAEQEAIKKLAVKFPPHPSVPPEEYLAYHLAHVRGEQQKKATNDKIKQNLSERPANQGTAGNDDMPKASRKITPLEAVRAAQRGETLE